MRYVIPLSVLSLALASCASTVTKDDPPPARVASSGPSASAMGVGDPLAILNGALTPGVAGAATSASAAPRKVSPYAPAVEDPSTRGDYVAGGLYKPGVRDSIAGITVDAHLIPEPEVEDLPRSRYGNKPVYAVLGKEYRVLEDTHGFAEEGTASYYGKKFHGRRTSAQEVYDMYAFSAAHKTLPIPSFARVTNLDNGQSVVVRVNDRGPFHEGRVIDLSLAAATKIGIVARGTGRVRVEALQPATRSYVHTRDSSIPLPSSAASALAIHFAPQDQDPPSTTPAPAPAPAPATAPVSAPITAGPSEKMQQGVPSKFMPAPMVETKMHATSYTQTDVLNQLPAGVTIATGVPGTPNNNNTPAPTAITSIPGQAPTETTTAEVAAGAYNNAEFRPDAARFSLHQNGKTMSADNFDEWLKTQKISIATGAPRPVEQPPLQATAETVVHQAVATADQPPTSDQPMAGEAKQVVFAPNNSTSTVPAATLATMEPTQRVTLQIASFANQANANDAVAKLTAAGIKAHLVEGTSTAGAHIWRLRVGPVTQGESAALMERIKSLGLGQPQRVL